MAMTASSNPDRGGPTKCSQQMNGSFSARAGSLATLAKSKDMSAVTEQA
jgi:hypothetical protein